MLRLLARLSGFLALGAGLVSGIVDGARGIADNVMALTPLGGTASSLLPRQFQAIEPLVTRNLHPLLWDPVLLTLLKLPTVLAMFVVGTLLLVASRTQQGSVAAPT